MKKYLSPHVCGILCLLLLASGCAASRYGATRNSFYSTGQPNILIQVAPPLSLMGAGELWTNMPSDETYVVPLSSFTYALFGEEGAGPAVKSAHTIISSLPGSGWRFAMETWGGENHLSLSKEKRNGYFWSVHLLTVAAREDWISALWTANGRAVPDFWLAKRWSATVNDTSRIVAEYREAAPACMEKILREGSAPDKQHFWGSCSSEIEAFSSRADTAFIMEPLRAENRPEPISAPVLARPPFAPDLEKLVGKAEPVDNDLTSFSD